MKSIKQALLFLVGILLILVGIVGLFLPVLQGWLLIFLGLSLIAPRLARRLRSRLFRKLFKSNVVHLDEWKKSGVQAGFTTKRAPLFFQKTDDLLEAENQRKLVSTCRLTKLAVLGQVHGSEVAVLDDPTAYPKEGFYHFPRCDGALTNIAGLTLLVLSADCLPMLFRCGDWIGLAHAGWRGTRDCIATNMVHALMERSGQHPRAIRVIFGPCICVKHYEVGREFRDHFRPSSLCYVGNGRDRSLHFDLAKENETQLVRAGVKRRHILNHEICTFSESESFYSFRREGDRAGRIISFITKI